MDMNWLNWHEAIELSKYGIIASPKVMVTHGWAIHLGRVPVPPLPAGKDFGHEVFRRS
jgi:hypothetical protein